MAYAIERPRTQYYHIDNQLLRLENQSIRELIFFCPLQIGSGSGLHVIIIITFRTRTGTRQEKRLQSLSTDQS